MLPLTPSTPAPTRTPLQQAMLDAVTKARSTGKPVVVDAMTDEASKTVANPDGTLTTTDDALPVRTRRGGTWADIDSTLRPNSDGTLSPAVATTGLTFSGGGSGAMATVLTSDGKQLSVNAPFTLPRPTLNGATATYTDVLPGVDLQLTALPVGGWRDVIVVRTPQAAANPALKTLHFPLSGQGLTVSSDDQGRIEVKDDAGGLRFRSPAPLQWDSSRSATGSPTITPRSAKLAAAAPAAAPQHVGSGAPSTTEAPGDGANVAAIGSKVIGNILELTPDQDALGTGTGPWYLDPSLTAVTSYTQSSVEVQENHETAENYNKKSSLSTGFCGYHSPDPNLDCGKEGRQRAYFQFNVNPAIYSKANGAEVPPTLFTSTLNGQVTSAANPTANTPLAVFWAPTGIDEHTSWLRQPCGNDKSVVMQNCPLVSSQSVTGTVPLAIDVTDMMKRAAAGKWATWTIAIAPQTNEFDKAFRHAIASNPSVTTTYDITPTIWDPRTSPTPGFANRPGDTNPPRCTSGGTNPWDNPGWIGSNQNIYLTANSYSPSGQPLYTGYQMWDDNDSDFRPRPGDWGGSYNNPGVTVSVGSLSDGHQYGWLAHSTDDLLASPASNWCYFRVDKTNPRLSINSTDFPPSGTPNPSPARYAGDTDHPGTFVISAEDPSPGSGLQASGIACIRFSTDSTPLAGWQCGQPDTYWPGTPVQFAPRNWGTNSVYAWAMDVAGNYSQRADYNFYAPWKPGTQPVFGDVDNDQKPDIVITDANGNLRIIGGITDPLNSLAPAAAAPGTDSTHKPTWADYQITHRGTLNSGQAVDQIIAHNTKDADLKKKLYVVTSDGAGHFDAIRSGSLTRPGDCETVETLAACDGYNTQYWSDVSQVVAIGTPEGESLKKQGDLTVTNTRTSLLTVENGKLYLFPHGTSDDVMPTANLIPTLPGNGSWDDYDLINPGPANGLTGISATESKRQATLWARHRATGDIYAYPITWKNGAPDYSALTKPGAGTRILTGAGLTATSHSRIGAGDLNNDGYADLWVIDGTNAIAVFPGRSNDNTESKVDGFGQWSLVGYSDASVSLHPGLAPWQCADTEGGPRIDAQLAIWGCWNTTNQRFNFATDGTIRAGNYCVSTKDNALGNGAAVVLARCENKGGQKWAMRPDGRVYLPSSVDAATSPEGLCLELPGWAVDQGTHLGIWSCPGLQGNQQWTLNPERNR
ncbi:ricin-type beta-trefoil lectin domain protein [Kitasatospora sp. NPDC059327]|uniref:ricin-type beta-trefoil lectin domain protein n=1 Tax=Kitasatospora sp. NPDC059327 TaxID=3346803 RepID=UPI0036BCF7F3